MKDLHIHTIYSDGELNEYEILEEILKTNVKEFAICDHDTIEGSKKVFNILTKKNLPLKFHFGVELTCRFNEFKNGINMHLLVYDFNLNNETLLNLIKKVNNLRKLKIQRMVDLVYKEYNVKISEEKINEILKVTSSFGKPHIYSILSEMGEFNREEYYEKMNELNSKDLKLNAKEVILKLKDSCKVFLAHPVEIMKEYNLDINEIEKLIFSLKELGLFGVETYHSSQTKELQEKLSKITKKYGLSESCGSDFHGENVKPGLRIGDIQKVV